jgi:hypothetical protein
MAFTFRGIGTMHYGKRDFRSDESYITTLWFVCFYVPVVPISSKRIRQTGAAKYYGLRRSPTLVLQEKTKPNRTQVLSVYAWFAAELVIFITAKVQEAWWIAIPGVLLLGFPWILRKRAMDSIKAESARREMGFSPELPE